MQETPARRTNWCWYQVKNWNWCKCLSCSLGQGTWYHLIHILHFYTTLLYPESHHHQAPPSVTGILKNTALFTKVGIKNNFFKYQNAWGAKSCHLGYFEQEKKNFRKKFKIGRPPRGFFFQNPAILGKYENCQILVFLFLILQRIKF